LRFNISSALGYGSISKDSNKNLNINSEKEMDKGNTNVAKKKSGFFNFSLFPSSVNKSNIDNNLNTITESDDNDSEFMASLKSGIDNENFNS